MGVSVSFCKWAFDRFVIYWVFDFFAVTRHLMSMKGLKLLGTR